MVHGIRGYWYQWSSYLIYIYHTLVSVATGIRGYWYQWSSYLIYIYHTLVLVSVLLVSVATGISGVATSYIYHTLVSVATGISATGISGYWYQWSVPHIYIIHWYLWLLVSVLLVSVATCISGVATSYIYHTLVSVLLVSVLLVSVATDISGVATSYIYIIHWCLWLLVSVLLVSVE